MQYLDNLEKLANAAEREQAKNLTDKATHVYGQCPLPIKISNEELSKALHKLCRGE
jgi:hypothetical protein